MLKPAVRRSACDQCRAKRVRCLRAQDSTAPCARCCYMGAQCVTGVPGHPGRPPKQRPHAPAIAVASHSPTDPVVHEPRLDFGASTGEFSAFFDSPSESMNQSTETGEHVLSLTNQLSSPSQLQGLIGAEDQVNAMLHINGDSSTAFDMDMDQLLDHDHGLMPDPLPECFSAASSLVRFREEMDLRIATVDAYYSDPAKVLQHCKDGGAGRDFENPAALILTCSEEFAGTIQSLMPAAQLHTQTEDSFSTEIALLALSSYLALMRLFDSLFHRIYKFLCQLPTGKYESTKVKSVLRIGGVSALQDMPLKAYAIGILDAIQVQVQVIERCMGIPAEYCLSGDASASLTAAAPGIFSRPLRARLFWDVMAQEDVKSQRGSKSYVESIRASIKESMAFLDD